MVDPVPLPHGFVPASHVLEQKVKRGAFVSVIGVVIDCRLPMKTSGEDWKCTLTLCDLASQHDGDLTLNIFRPHDEMPRVGAGDVVLIFKVKVQEYRDTLSLITNRNSTVLMVYESAKIPQPPATAKPSWQEPKKRSSNDILSMVAQAEAYIPSVYHDMDNTMIPDATTFELASARSLNVNDKFSLLEGVRQDKFYNVIVQVVRPPYDLADKASIWVTDYTENGAFYHKTSDGVGDDESSGHAPAGDPLGYTSRFQSLTVASSSGTSGPYGKRCMQVTCYEPHATRIRDLVKSGSWIMIRNLQVKYGSNGNNLEGFLREARNASAAQVQVELLNPLDDPENADTRLKNALIRKRDYWKELKAQSMEKIIQPGKRKQQFQQSEEKAPNAKRKRKLQRQQERDRKKAESEVVAAVPNVQVICEHPKQPLTAIAKILERHVYRTTSMSQPHEIPLPFNCVKYRAIARVSDFFPRDIQDFASWRKPSEFDILRDTADSASSMSDSELGSGSEVIWEWRFSLRLQDAAKPAKQASSDALWVVVDNAAAQLLLGFDACDLRTDTNALGKLRERLSLLWGNLEQLKAEKRKRAEATKARKKAKQPPLDSSDAEGTSTQPQGSAPQPNNLELDNQPFACCIRQYGVRVKEASSLKADAGCGRRWDRLYGLFGTKIRTA